MAAGLRSADPADAGAITRVHLTARRAYYEAGGIAVPDDNPGRVDDYHAFWSEMLAAADNRAWIATDGTDCVGFMLAGPPAPDEPDARSTLKLIALYMLPDVWGSGLADSLHRSFVEQAMDTPAVRWGLLDVWAGNKRAQSFYRRHGWKPDGRARQGPGNLPFIFLRLAVPE